MAANRLTRLIPPDRRVKGLGGAHGRRLLQVRKLIAPVLQLPITLRTAGGLKLRITGDPVDEQIAQHVLGPRRAEYFPADGGRIPANPCILDIGAHHGLYAAAALHAYPGSHIICVEPSAGAVPDLRTNLKINGFEARARVVNAALGAHAGHALLRHTAEGSWGASLYEDAEVTDSSEDVTLTTLADILGADRPHVLKCNAEGAEYSLFDQLEASDVRPVFMLVMVHPEFGDLERLETQAIAMGYELAQHGTDDHPAFHMWAGAAPAR
jgi:FkbM family methyltransferase